MTDAPVADLWAIELTTESIRRLCREVGLEQNNQMTALELIVEDTRRRTCEPTITAAGLKQMLLDPILRAWMQNSDRDFYSPPAMETCDEFIRRLQASLNATREHTCE